MKKKTKKPYWIDKKREKEPKYWFMNASDYRSAAFFILDEYSNIKNGDKISHLLNAISAVPYLIGLSAELYMKGYLVFKEVSPTILRKKIGHNLDLLRKKCLIHGDERFENDDLIFLTDTLGEHLMKSGGIKYPDKEPMAIYTTQFKKALNILREISMEIKKIKKP